MDNKLTTVVEMPTGSGKSYIATIVAEQYRVLGLNVAIVTSQDYLVQQLEDILGPVRHDIKVLAMQSALSRLE